MKIQSIFMAAMIACTMFIAPVEAADSININTATVEQLETVKGFGPKTASAIVAYRDAHGDFKAVSDLVNVKGIGEKTLERVRDALTVGGQDAEASRDGAEKAGNS